MNSKKRNKEHFNFDWLTAIITLFIGFFFTKLINPLLERLFSVFLQLGGTFVNSIADSTYREISKGFCEQSAYLTANYIFGVCIGLFFIFFIYLKNTLANYSKTFDLIDKTNSILNDEYNQEESDHAATIKDSLPTTDSLRKKIKTTYFVTASSFALIILLLSYSFGRMSFINKVITRTTNNIEIVAPYISDNEYKMLKSTFHSMQTKEDYKILTNELNSIAKKYSIHLK